MSYEEVIKFCETYAFIEKRAEEYYNIFEPIVQTGWTSFSGIEVDEYGVDIKYDHVCYGETEVCTMSLPYEDLDPNINLKEKYAKEIEDRELQKMLREERAEKAAKQNAQRQIDELKRQYGL